MPEHAQPTTQNGASWLPAVGAAQSVSAAKAGHVAIQPESGQVASPTPVIQPYSRGVADRLAANVTRGLQADKSEDTTLATLTDQPHFNVAATSGPNGIDGLTSPPAPPIDVGGATNSIQRQCAECTNQEQRQTEESSQDLDKIAAGGLQTKLTVGAPGDPFEQEADRVAAQVMSMPEPVGSMMPVQRLLAADNPVQLWQRAQSPTPTPIVHRRIHRQVQTQGVVQRAFESGGEASANLENRLNAAKGGGSPLSEEARTFMEPRFNSDFSGVRVHTGSTAVQMNQELGAHAFTHGQDVFFNQGKYNPGSDEGKFLLAHELTHVVQQTGAVQQRKSTSQASTINLKEIPILQGSTPDSNVLSHLQSFHSSGTNGSSIYRKEILQFQKENTSDRIIAAQQQVLESNKSVDIQQKDNSQTLRKCGTPCDSTPTPQALIPFDRNPLAAPGEQILFNSSLQDPTPDNFKLVYTGAGGTFDTRTGPNTKTISGLRSGNLPFFIDSSWDGTTPVTVKLQVQCKSDNKVVSTYDWTFGKKTYYPTTIDQLEGEGERPLPSTYSYKIGPDRGGDGVDDYLHQTILEKFEQRSCNITEADLGRMFKVFHPGVRTPEQITAYFFGTSSNNGTFTVSAGDKIYDRHSGGMPDKEVFESALATMKEVYVDLPQTYEAEPNVTLGRYNVRRILKVDGSKKVQKSKQP